MIKSFKDKETEKLWNKGSSTKIPVEIQLRGLKKLRLIDASNNLNDLAFPPSNQLEQLKGDRKGQHSIRINDQYRICFMWVDNNAYNVEIVDYH
jgi:proteic killer suppression protein